MMKFKYLYLLLILFPLMLACTKGDKGGSSVPPPVMPGTEEEENKDDEKDDDDGPKPWDENRGKSVRPEAGNGWTISTVADGIIYYAFAGKESVTNANQRIFVTEIDLNNTAYAVKMAYEGDRSTTSAVYKKTKAIACINGGYERGSLWIRLNGTNYSTLPNDYITSGSYQVPQWKSEAAVYLDGERDVRLEFTGRDMNLAEWRAAYRAKCSTERTFITSAPMLIDDFEPVGEQFCTLHPVTYANCSEDPYVHQASTTNPRTLLAKTEDNHLLFMVVDGRRNISRGISAAELTRFLVKNFNPQYAINLDGGGSSTMCVQGQGDSETNVVNYPTDSDKVDARPGAGDHTGERSVPTFFYVVKK